MLLFLIDLGGYIPWSRLVSASGLKAKYYNGSNEEIDESVFASRTHAFEYALRQLRKKEALQRRSFLVHYTSIQII